MGNNINFLLILILPLLFLFVYSLLPGKKRKITNVSNWGSIILLVILIFCIAMYPVELSSDKFRYVRMYFSALDGYSNYEYRDYGWILYNIVCSRIFGRNVDFFFFLTAFIYVSSFYIIAKRYFPDKTLGYYIIMSTGCLGFLNYGTNVIRAGVALSLLLITISWDKIKIFRIIFVIFALSFQKSVAIPIMAFFVATNIKNIRWALSSWCVCFILSASDLDLGPIFENFGFVDERVDKYIGSMDSEEDSNYKKGFRLDFVIYSVVPILISLFYIWKKKINDRFYNRIVGTYLWANSVWLLAIRMAYTDRLAYLSWFLIPLLTLYPIFNYQHRFKRPQRLALFIIYMFLGVNLFLSLRSVLQE